MSITTIKMRRPAQGELKDIASAFRRKYNETFAEFLTETWLEGTDLTVCQMLYERFYFRNSSYATVIILLSEQDGEQRVLINGCGGGDGLFNISLGANNSFAYKTKDYFQAQGFEVLSEERRR